MKRIYNFSAGPGILPQDALDAASEAVIDYNNNGISILEMSHRSQPVVDLMNETSFLARELLMLLAISIGVIPFLYSFTAPSGKVISIISVNLFQKYGL